MGETPRKACFRNHPFDAEKWRWNGHSWSCNECAKITERARRKRRRKLDPAAFILGELRRAAKRRGRNFTIVAADIEPLPTHCPVFGVELDYTGTGAANAASVDRVDSHGDYVAGNVAVISKRANVLKNNATIPELEQLLAYLRSSELVLHLQRQQDEAERRPPTPAEQFKVALSRRFPPEKPRFKSAADRRAWIRANLTPQPNVLDTRIPVT